ncbi:RsiV family protein [Enterocloster sp. 210928-DFI.2.20]|uniref:RsiV family protein n=1 Tax=Enterocloster TaxID=2719313 RepID=UPI001D08D8E2|nr:MULTISPECIES: RsiV family protein [Enterocloster]MCB7094587.1 RsiV family protein [Enterocloster sp. 210928-DFI.2.20]MCB7353981.1 RsiV family protein [Enterocloster bolteae]
MRQIEDARKRYEEIPIPAELSGRVRAAIVRSEEKRKSQRQRIPTVRIRRKHRIWGTCAGMAAALVLVFTTALNTNTAFAEMAAGLPVIGAAARILTFRSYERDEGDWKISVEIPSVEMIAKDTNGLDSALNQEIYDLCSQYADEAVERAREYKKAFMETGGTEEEWEAHDINIHVGYEIKAQTEAYLSFAVQGTENWSSAYSETKYYNIDLKDNKMVTLADVLGHDYARIADESILRQMENMEEKEGIAFWSKSEGGFTGVTDKTVFYMNEKENPVIVFDKYEIAPGAYGKLEFEIDKTENMAEKTGYTDNFMVPEEEITAFAGKVKEAVADRDMDALASLASYPLYVGFKDGGVSAGSPEELAALGTDRIFTPELAAAVEAAGDETLSPSMAGFVLKKDGTPNIVFGVSEGVLAVKGINY